MNGQSSMFTRLRTGERIEVNVASRLTNAALWARGEVAIDGVSIVSKKLAGGSPVMKDEP